MTLDELNGLAADRATEVFSACCGARRWVSGMIERRPFSSIDEVADVANEIWQSMDERDWREAFDHHPRIGESWSRRAPSVQAARWSSGEQARAAAADADTKRGLAETNAAYEARFGHIYIVCADGRTAEELLGIARSRLNNDPGAELRLAAEEQRKIIELRLRKLFEEAP